MQGSELGEGSFATVEECVLRGERVAVKRLRTELVSNLDEVECFLARGMTVSKLDHPCARPDRIVTLAFTPTPHSNACNTSFTLPDPTSRALDVAVSSLH